ncbi:MAG: alkane 1-monooxygenase [Leptospira sp.]|nr:alkane 1-monooxygenase [Leptospira sp.]
MNLTKRLSFLLCFLLPVIAIYAELNGGYTYLIVPITVFVILPLLDLFVGKDVSNPKDHEFYKLQDDKYFRILTFAWAIFQIIFVIWACIQIALNPHSMIELLLFALSVGIITGAIGITVGHELGHKSTRLEQFLAKMIYMTVCYMHFYIEHNRGHHVNVSTELDPATSKKNQNFYMYYPKTFFGSILSAWNIEAKRLTKMNLSVLNYRNEMLWYALITLGFASFLLVISSFIAGTIVWKVLGFFFLQAFIATFLLELTNYIEHYGLRRKEISQGKFEKVSLIHSWNQNFLVSNALLFQLQRHSDHHANASRRYQTLRHIEEAPQLPFGYEVMILIALIPPLWFKIMNPILEAWEIKNGMEKVNSIS